MPLDPSDLVLQRVLRWERERASHIYMTQPLGGGRVRDYTWGTAVGEARRMAAHLRSLDYPPGSRIAILSKNCAHFILSDLAIWMAGHVSVALYPTLNSETVRYILEHSAARLLFVGKLDGWETMKPGVPAAIAKIAYSLSPAEPRTEYPVWEDIVARTEPLTGELARPGSDTALIMYTSGSTGKPKGVEHTFESMGQAAHGYHRAVGFRVEDRMLSYLPLAHALERAMIEAISLHFGPRIFFAESVDTFVADVKRAQPTLFQAVPRLWLKFQQGVLRKMPAAKLERMLRIPIVSRLVKKKILTGLGLDACRMAVSGSAPITPELIEWYRRLGLELCEGYGMSENFCYSHLSLPGRTRVGYVGAPVPGVECRLSPEGEVLVKSPASMKGYYLLPDETRDAFTEDGFLRTGDRGEVDGEQRLKITGRVKELFKTSKGKYIAPVPIENLLAADAMLEQACVSGANQTQPYALLVLNEDLRTSLAAQPDRRAEIERALGELRDKVNAQLDPHEHLAFLVVVDQPWAIENGMLTPTMKIRRSVVEQHYEPSVVGWYGKKRSVLWESAAASPASSSAAAS